MIYTGDSLEILKTLPENSVDSIVTDPPYGLSFMGKKWDYDVPSVELWVEAKRVLKPGGHLLSFAGSRTYHRMAVNIEDAGFEIRDMMTWNYGQGFPKSMNISLQIKKKYSMGLCTCDVFEPMIELGYENNNRTNNSGDGDNDGQGLSKKVWVERGRFKEEEGGTRDKIISSESGVRDNGSEVCELQQKDNQKEQGFKKVKESVLQQGVPESGTEKERYGYAEIREGVEKDKGIYKEEGQGVPDLQTITSGESAGSSFDTIQDGRDKQSKKLGGAVQELSFKDREDNRERVKQIRDDCGVEEWNNLSRFICSKCYKLQKDIGGTALKPSIEPIVVARKPFKGTVANNVLKYGTGGINIDGCRVEIDKYDPNQRPNGSISLEDGGKTSIFKQGGRNPNIGGDTLDMNKGRFPANFIHDGSDEVVELFPESKSSNGKANTYEKEGGQWGNGKQIRNADFGDSGSTARFFYCAKASKRERLLDGFYCATLDTWKDENMEQAVSLAKAILDMVARSSNIGGYGKNTMGAYQTECLSTILTTINKITELKTWSLLMHSPTKEYIADVFGKKMDGTNHVESAKNLKELMTQIGIFQEKVGLATEDVKNATLELLLKLKEKDAWKPATSHHPTHKPIKLMQYLVRLVTPKGATVLDPFMGSGSTGIACVKEGMDFIGIDLDPEYVKIAEARIEHAKKETSSKLF